LRMCHPEFISGSGMRCWIKSSMTEKGGDRGRGSKTGKYIHLVTFPPRVGGNW